MPYFGKAYIAKGDKVMPLARTESTRAFQCDEDDIYQIGGWAVTSEILDFLESRTLHDVQGLDKYGNVLLANCPDAVPVVLIESVYDGRVLLSSKLPANEIGTAEDDCDIFALAGLKNYDQPIAKMALVNHGKCMGTVELSIDPSELRLVHRDDTMPIRTVQEYRRAMEKGGATGMHAFLHATVIPDGMDEISVFEANLVLALKFSSIEEAWHHFSCQNNIDEALRVCYANAAQRQVS